MGTIYAGEILGRPSPKVGLLNIGEEAIKGNDVVKQAAELLRDDMLKLATMVFGCSAASGGGAADRAPVVRRHGCCGCGS